MSKPVLRHTQRLTAALLLGLTALTTQAQPPAPVPVVIPDAVKMARPTPAEVDKAKASLAAFLANADADTKKIVAAYPDLIEVHPPGRNTAIQPDLRIGFLPKHQNNVKVAEAGDIDLLFMGDSITDFWRNPEGNYAGKPVMDKVWPNVKIANFGIAGDTTQGVLYRLRDGEGKGFSPKAIMLMIGTNNTATNSAGEIAEGVGGVVTELQKDFPNAKILLLGIFPRATPDSPLRTTIANINKVIAKLDDQKKVFYLDIGKVFLDANGVIGKDIMSDGLHPTTKGYELWANAVKDPLAKLMK
ncbi:MAG TPA: GDSL-type esterase/lipase family protein [Candidatus Acidoferrum sp.]|nr:GDSL-type esterase/lipase family protein [Candidatus Acidoferrum sp.]